MEVLYFLQLPLNYFSYMFKTTKFRSEITFYEIIQYYSKNRQRQADSPVILNCKRNIPDNPCPVHRKTYWLPPKRNYRNSFSYQQR